MPEFTSEQRLKRALARMKFDDALHFIGFPHPTSPITLSPYHVEYLSLSKGFTQYRLYHQNKLVGIVDVRESREGHVLKTRQHQLALYLLKLDIADSTPHIVQMGAITPITADTTHCPRLVLPTVDEGLFD